MLTEKQKQYIRDNSHLICIKEMEKVLDESYNTIYNFIYKNKLSIVPSPYHVSKEPYINKKQVELASYRNLKQNQREYIEANASTSTIRQMANELGVDYRFVYVYCKDHNIEFKSDMPTKKYEESISMNGLWDVDAMPDWILGW